MNLEQLISELQERNREEVKKKVQAVAGTNMHVSWKEIEEIHNKSLANTAHAVASALISLYKRDLEAHLTTLEETLQDKK